MDGTGDLPTCIQVTQKISHNPGTEKILKTGLVYAVLQWSEEQWFSIPQRTFEQQPLNDPLIVMASLFTGRIILPEEVRIQILKTQFAGCHDAEDRLWTGQGLSTQNVFSSILIWPDIHTAYTEKVRTVFNHSRHEWSGINC